METGGEGGASLLSGFSSLACWVLGFLIEEGGQEEERVSSSAGSGSSGKERVSVGQLLLGYAVVTNSLHFSRVS